MYVKSLYASIPNHEGVVAVKKRFNKYTNKMIPTKIITFLALTFTLNNVIFNSKLHPQVQGHAMGAIFAAIYANIFMAKFEEKYIYSFIKQILMLYLRFVGNISMIWTRSKNELEIVM